MIALVDAERGPRNQSAFRRRANAACFLLRIAWSSRRGRVVPQPPEVGHEHAGVRGGERSGGRRRSCGCHTASRAGAGRRARPPTGPASDVADVQTRPASSRGSGQTRPPSLGPYCSGGAGGGGGRGWRIREVGGVCLDESGGRSGSIEGGHGGVRRSWVMLLFLGGVGGGAGGGACPFFGVSRM